MVNNLSQGRNLQIHVAGVKLCKFVRWEVLVHKNHSLSIGCAGVEGVYSMTHSELEYGSLALLRGV